MSCSFEIVLMRVYSSRVLILKFLPVIFCGTVNIILLCYKLILFYPSSNVTFWGWERTGNVY